MEFISHCNFRRQLFVFLRNFTTSSLVTFSTASYLVLSNTTVPPADPNLWDARASLFGLVFDPVTNSLIGITSNQYELIFVIAMDTMTCQIRKLVAVNHSYAMFPNSGALDAQSAIVDGWNIVDYDLARGVVASSSVLAGNVNTSGLVLYKS